MTYENHMIAVDWTVTWTGGAVMLWALPVKMKILNNAINLPFTPARPIGRFWNSIFVTYVKKGNGSKSYIKEKFMTQLLLRLRCVCFFIIHFGLWQNGVQDERQVWLIPYGGVFPHWLWREGVAKPEESTITNGNQGSPIGRDTIKAHRDWETGQQISCQYSFLPKG